MDNIYHEKFYREMNNISPVSPEGFRSFLSIFRYKALEKGEFLTTQGGSADFFGYVLSGCLKMFYIDDKANEYIKQFSGENSYTGALSAKTMNLESNLNIQAITNSQILVASFDLLDRQSKNNIEIERLRRKILERLIQLRDQREFELLTLTATERYKNFLQNFPELKKTVQDREIASYLGISPVSLSRIKKYISGYQQPVVIVTATESTNQSLVL